MKSYNRIVTNMVTVMAMISLTSCATIINEKTQKINVATSTGERASILIDGMPFEAPGIATVTRAKADKIITSKSSKCNESTIVPSKVDTVFFINVLSGGVFGSTTDYASEKMWKYDDNVTISCKN